MVAGRVETVTAVVTDEDGQETGADRTCQDGGTSEKL